jgi:hypothetical protein
MSKQRKFKIYKFDKCYDKSLTIFVSKCCHSTVEQMLYTLCTCNECHSKFPVEYTEEMFVWNQSTPQGIYRKNSNILNLNF